MAIKPGLRFVTSDTYSSLAFYLDSTRDMMLPAGIPVLVIRMATTEDMMKIFGKGWKTEDIASENYCVALLKRIWS